MYSAKAELFHFLYRQDNLSSLVIPSQKGSTHRACKYQSNSNIKSVKGFPKYIYFLFFQSNHKKNKINKLNEV